jgi:outer membrane protein
MKMKNIYSIFILCFLLIIRVGYSQPYNSLQPFEPEEGYQLVTLEEAISYALENNHSIRVARSNAEVAENNVYLGNANLLPQLFLEGSYNPALQNIDLEFFQDIPPIAQNNAFSRVANLGAGINYRIFDGFNNINAYNILREETKVAQAQTRQEIENTLVAVINNYLEVARLEQEFRINQKMIELSIRRWERSRTAYEFGGQTRLEMLNAEVDLNTDSINLIRNDLALNNAKRNLKVLMGMSPDKHLTVSTDVEINEDIRFDELHEKALANNSRMQAARFNRNISNLNINAARSGMFPVLDLNMGYNINQQFNEAGFVQRQLIRGFTGGVGFRYNIFDGRRRVVQTQNARINRDAQQEQLEQIQKEVERDVMNTFAEFQNALYLLKLENRNLRTVQLNFERSQEAYNLGQVSTTQLREAQINLSRAEFRIAELHYQAKLSEIELYRIAGLLLN